MLCPHCNSFIPTEGIDLGEWVSCGKCEAAVQVPDDAHADATLATEDTFFDDRKAAQGSMFRTFRRQSLVVASLVFFVLATIVGYSAWQATGRSNNVAQVRALGGVVLYDYQFNDDLDSFQFSDEPQTRVWLHKMFGPDYVYHATAVDLGRDHSFLKSEHFGYQELSGLEMPDFAPTVNDEQLKVLEEMNYLQMLSLADQPITDRGLRQIKHLDRLVYLDLRNTKLTDKAVPTLAALGRLKFLDLSGTEVSREGHIKLTAALPHATILRGRPFMLH